jgi:hypothetical protein
MRAGYLLEDMVIGRLNRTSALGDCSRLQPSLHRHWHVFGPSPFAFADSSGRTSAPPCHPRTTQVARQTSPPSAPAETPPLPKPNSNPRNPNAVKNRSATRPVRNFRLLIAFLGRFESVMPSLMGLLVHRGRAKGLPRRDLSIVQRQSSRASTQHPEPQDSPSGRVPISESCSGSPSSSAFSWARSANFRFWPRPCGNAIGTPVCRTRDCGSRH